MRKLPIILIALFFAISTQAQNNSFESATLLPTAGLTAELNTGSDRFYYRLIVSQNATLNFSIDGKKLTGGTQGINVYFYDRSRRNILSKTGIGSGTAAGANIKETISLHSLSPDTIYVLIMKNSDYTFSFNLKYNLSNTGNTDAEPNNERAKAVPVNHNQVVQGHIGYKANGKIDNYDYYKIIPPANGTIKIYAEAVHTGGSDGSYGMYFYDKSGRNIFSKPTMGKNISYGESLKDTLTIYSRNADTIYFSVYQNSNRLDCYLLLLA